MNGFSPVPAYPPIDFGGVARSNVETLRFTAGLDLTKETDDDRYEGPSDGSFRLARFNAKPRMLF
jgi:hypothetical protein